MGLEFADVANKWGNAVKERIGGVEGGPFEEEKTESLDVVFGSVDLLH